MFRFIGCVCLVLVLSYPLFCGNCPAGQPLEMCALNTIFENFYRSCKLPFPPTLKKPKTFGDQTVVLPPVPSDLAFRITQFGMRDVQSYPSLSLMRILSQIRPSQDLSGNIDDFIGETASKNPADFKQVGFTGEIYSTSCQAAMSDNLKASGGASFGPATVSASLDASMRFDAKSGLFFTKGRFDSPIYAFTHSGVGPLYADILMLSWRGQHNDSSTQYYYLAHVTGFTATQLTTQDLYSSASAASHLGVGIVSISASNDFSISGGNETRQDQSDFFTVFTKPQTSDYELVPNSSDLQKAIKSYGLPQPSVLPSQRQLSRVGDSATVTQVVNGIPEDVCSIQGGWSWTIMDDVSTQDSWDVSGAGLVEALGDSSVTGLPQCKFTFSITSKKDQAQFTAQPILIASNSNGATFTLKIPPMTFTQGAFPLLASAQSSSAQPSQTVSTGVLKYSLPLKIVQAPNGAGYTNLTVISATIDADCGSLKVSFVPQADSVSFAQNNASLVTLSVELDFTSNFGPPDLSDPNMLSCTISKGGLILTSTAIPGSTIAKDLAGLGLKLSLPHVKPTINFSVSGNASSAVVTGSLASVNSQDLLKALKGKNVELVEGNTQIASAPLDEAGNFNFSRVSVAAGTHNFVVALEPFGIIEAIKSDVKQVVLNSQ